MNAFTMRLSKNHLVYRRLVRILQKIPHKCLSNGYSTVEVFDAFTMDLRQRRKTSFCGVRPQTFDVKKITVRFMMDAENPLKDVSKMTSEELDNTIMQLMSKNKDEQIADIITECSKQHVIMSDIMLKKLFRNYSNSGKPIMVDVLQQYTAKLVPNLHKKNGDFEHYMAKAQCMKGNSEKGLTIITNCYKKNVGLRNNYRTILRELIQDSVLNRSEASLVIFRKYVLEYSIKWSEHYPLVCLWHICWSSSWFSDQMLSNDLLEESTSLQEIVRDKATAFSIMILRQEYNEDAVMRLLQTLLKYDMMTEYVKVLQVLFGYKLKNRDLRACAEIIRNCEALDVTLPSYQQGRYIKMIIEEKQPATKTVSKTFKLKF